MRGIALGLAAFGLLSTSLTAQAPAWGGFAGFSTAGVSYGCCGSAHGRRTGLTIGASFRSRLSNRFSLSANLLRSSKGFTESEPTIQYSYLEFPVLVHFEFKSRTAEVQPYFGVGLAPALRMSCRRFFTGVDGFHEDHCQATRASNLDLVGIRSYDIAEDFRLGLRLAGVRPTTVLEVRYARGIIDTEPGAQAHNRFLAVTVGLEW